MSRIVRLAAFGGLNPALSTKKAFNSRYVQNIARAALSVGPLRPYSSNAVKSKEMTEMIVLEKCFYVRKSLKDIADRIRCDPIADPKETVKEEILELKTNASFLHMNMIILADLRNRYLNRFLKSWGFLILAPVSSIVICQVLLAMSFSLEMVGVCLVLCTGKQWMMYMNQIHKIEAFGLELVKDEELEKTFTRLFIKDTNTPEKNIRLAVTWQQVKGHLNKFLHPQKLHQLPSLNKNDVKLLEEFVEGALPSLEYEVESFNQIENK